MTDLQFNNQEEFEQYIANRNQSVAASHRNKTVFWKMVPPVLGAFVVGFVLMFNYPAAKTGAHDGRRAEKQEKRFDTVLRWLGVDVDKRKRDHQRLMERMKNSQPDLHETKFWSQVELQQLPQFFDD